MENSFLIAGLSLFTLLAIHREYKWYSLGAVVGLFFLAVLSIVPLQLPVAFLFGWVTARVIEAIRRR